jgi:glycine cleavage system P protein (glycine dehydrogenase) subunit 2
MMYDKTIFDLSAKGRCGASPISAGVPDFKLPDDLLRAESAALPEVTEVDVVRHFTRLSQKNFGIDIGMYPLGSCTMKYNPRINEVACRLPGFARIHPGAPPQYAQGALQLMHELQSYLAEITGLDVVTLQPAAGAQGELTGLMMIRAWHSSQGNPRRKVLIPDTAHGTNPASSALCNYSVETVPSNDRGTLDLASLREKMTGDVAALMVTNPNTLGLFEKDIAEAAEIVHQAGGLIYLDGANMNAIMGIVRPGDFGVDVMHLNLHKTFSTPHGGGGPGSGPVAAKSFLAPYLPSPIITKSGDQFFPDYDRPQSIGRVQAFFGNFGVLARAYAYIREMGPEGLKFASEMAVLNANYIRENLKGTYHLPYDEVCMHECVFSEKGLPDDLRTLDVAKRLMDHGFHPPTVYFPLIVKGAIMVEPTETESLENCDAFIQAMKTIRAEAENDPNALTSAPTTTPIGRADEVMAVKKLRLTANMDD